MATVVSTATQAVFMEVLFVEVTFPIENWFRAFEIYKDNNTCIHLCYYLKNCDIKTFNMKQA